MKRNIFEETVARAYEQKRRKMDRELVVALSHPRTAEEMMDKLLSLRSLQRKGRAIV